jgi:hypothetical protein
MQRARSEPIAHSGQARRRHPVAPSRALARCQTERRALRIVDRWHLQRSVNNVHRACWGASVSAERTVSPQSVPDS